MDVSFEALTAVNMTPCGLAGRALKMESVYFSEKAGIYLRLYMASQQRITTP
jgi:hypothetical protein